MYGAIYKCKMCGKEFPYINPKEKKWLKEHEPTDTRTYTAYGAHFPENRISNIEKEPPQHIPHYCNNDSDAIGVAELIGFREMVGQGNANAKNSWLSMDESQKRSCLQDDFDYQGIDEDKYLPIIEFILKDGFNMTGWELYEVPISGQYCFFNNDTNQCFDISVSDDGIITAQYMDSKEGEYYNTMFDAESISDAVSRYNFPEADVYPSITP